MSRSFNSLTLVFTKIKICYFSFVKAKKFPMIFTFEGFKVNTSKLHRQILEPYLYFFFSIFLFLKKQKKTKQWCLICWNKFVVTFVFFLFTIYLLTTWQLFICQKPTKNTAQIGPNSVTHRF